MGLKRVIGYVDGFNLYYGLRAARMLAYRWLNIRFLCEAILPPTHRLELVRYFTTMVKGDPDKSSRQAVFIDALRTLSGIQFDFGHFLSKPVKCRSCGCQWAKQEEKKTDVNIAVRLLEDAIDDKFDKALIISGDSDLVPAIEAIHNRYSDKQIVLASPPKRVSRELRKVADERFVISISNIRSSLFPNPVVNDEGIELWAPEGWLPEHRQ